MRSFGELLRSLRESAFSSPRIDVFLPADSCFPECGIINIVVPNVSRHRFSLSSITVPASVKYIKEDSFGWIRDEVEKHVLYCSKDSFAHQFAVENEIPFFLTDSEDVGDFNFDGKIAIDDVTTLQRSLAEFSGVPNAENSAVVKLTDVNGDGRFNIKDATKIQRDLAEL